MSEDLYPGSISGQDLMKYYLISLLKGQACLGGRVIILESKDIPYIISLYESFPFQKLEMIKILE